jgi:hypothetical protein
MKKNRPARPRILKMRYPLSEAQTQAHRQMVLAACSGDYDSVVCAVRNKSSKRWETIIGGTFSDVLYACNFIMESTRSD